jgi:hypothetical protein
MRLSPYHHGYWDEEGIEKLAAHPARIGAPARVNARLVGFPALESTP